MKIALVCDRWDDRGGGLELWAQQFVAGMRARGHALHVVTFDARSPAEGATLHVLTQREGKLAKAEAVEAAVGQLRADIVHDTGVGWSSDVIHPHAGSKLANNHRHIESLPRPGRWLRQLRPRYWKWRLDVQELERRQYEQSSGTIVAPSNRVAEDLKALYGVSDNRIHVVPNAVNTDRFSPERRETLRDDARRRYGFGEETVFLFSAMNPILKGAWPLLRAMRRLRGCRLLMIGGEPPKEYRTIEGVVFTGYAGDPAVPLAAADAVVHPTYYDACSLTVLEAWACGLPVVTTRFNGGSELMEDGAEGFQLDDPDDDRKLAAAMEHLIDPLVRKRMSPAARALALKNTFESHLERIETVYRSVR